MGKQSSEPPRINMQYVESSKKRKRRISGDFDQKFM